MKTEADYYALFDAYRSGLLAPDEQASLERRLNAEPDLAQ